MKTIVAIAFAFSMLFGMTSTASAQAHDHSQHGKQQEQQAQAGCPHMNGMNHGAMNHGGMNHGGMNHGGMNHGAMNHDAMMKNPAMRAGMTVVALPGLKDVLGLSDAQVASLRETRDAYLQKAAPLVKKYVESKDADARKQLESLAAEAKAKVEAQLSADQLKKLEGIGPNELHPAMMAAMQDQNVSQLMASACPMMGAKG